MSASNEFTEFHLTPRGWIRGSDKTDGCPVEEVPRPDDAVLTLRYTSRQSGLHSPVIDSIGETWRATDATTVPSLNKKFGRTPEGYEKYLSSAKRRRR